MPTSLLRQANIKSPKEFERSSTQDFLVKRKEKVKEEEGLRLVEDEIDVKFNPSVYTETSQLLRYAKSFREKLESKICQVSKVQERLSIYTKLSSEVDIEKLQKEKEENKEMFWSEWKRNSESRVLLESQKRQINSQIHFSSK